MSTNQPYNGEGYTSLPGGEMEGEGSQRGAYGRPRLGKMYVRPLKGSLMFFHLVLGLLGVTLLGYATWLYVAYHRTGYTPTPPAPTPTPNGSDWIVMGDHSEGLVEQQQHRMVRVVLAPPPPPPQPLEGSPWSIYVMGGLGGFMLVVALTGYSAVKADARRLMGVFVGMLVVLVLVHVAIVLFVCTDNPWKEKLPSDPSGWWNIVSQYIESHDRLVRMTCLIVIGVEFLALLLSFWLHSVYQAAYEDWLDDIEERQARAREILGRAAENAYARGTASAWNSRAKSKYGIESNRLQENTQALHQTAMLTGDE